MAKILLKMRTSFSCRTVRADARARHSKTNEYEIEITTSQHTKTSWN